MFIEPESVFSVMNNLVYYLGEHYDPKGFAVKGARVSELENSSFSVEEIFSWAMEAREAGLIEIARIHVKDGRYGVDAMLPKDLDFVTLTREGQTYYKHHKNQPKT